MTLDERQVQRIVELSNSTGCSLAAPDARQSRLDDERLGSGWVALNDGNGPQDDMDQSGQGLEDRVG